MTESKESLITLPQIGRVEKTGLIVTVLLTAVAYVLGSSGLAAGVLAGGVLFTANFIAIRFLVNSLVANTYPTSFGIFILIMKMLIFVAIVITLFLFAKVNIYGFFIGVTGIIFVIIGESLRGSKDGSL